MNYYYVKNGKPSGEIPPLKQALKFLRRLYGSSPTAEFSPLGLKAVREAMIVHPITRKVRVIDPDTKTVYLERKVFGVGLSRRVVNKQIGRIKRVFAWAVEEELLPVEVHAALVRVTGLKKNRSAAREKARVKPVTLEALAATLPFVPATVAAMVMVQRLTGCRPQEVVLLRAEDIDRRVRCGRTGRGATRPNTTTIRTTDSTRSPSERIPSSCPRRSSRSSSMGQGGPQRRCENKTKTPRLPRVVPSCAARCWP